MRKFYLSCKFCTLTIILSEVVLPGHIAFQIIVFGKERLRNVLNTSQDVLTRTVNLMIRLENVLKISLQDVLKTSWRCLEDVFQDILKTSWQDVLKMCWRPFEDVFKTSWRLLENVLKTLLQDVLKTSWRRLKNVLKTSWRRMTKTNILVFTKTSSEDVKLRRAYSSWSRRLLKAKTKDLHQDECLLDMFMKKQAFTKILSKMEKILKIKNIRTFISENW